MEDSRTKYLLAKEAAKDYLLGFISHQQYCKETEELPQDTVIELPEVVKREAYLIAGMK